MAIATRTADIGHTTHAPSLLSRLVDVYSVWRRRTMTRTELARLDERMLRDIGVSHNALEQEVSKPFWRA